MSVCDSLASSSVARVGAAPWSYAVGSQMHHTTLRHCHPFEALYLIACITSPCLILRCSYTGQSGHCKFDVAELPVTDGTITKAAQRGLQIPSRQVKYLKAITTITPVVVYINVGLVLNHPCS